MTAKNTSSKPNRANTTGTCLGGLSYPKNSKPIKTTYSQKDFRDWRKASWFTPINEYDKQPKGTTACPIIGNIKKNTRPKSKNKTATYPINPVNNLTRLRDCTVFDIMQYIAEAHLFDRKEFIVGGIKVTVIREVLKI